MPAARLAATFRTPLDPDTADAPEALYQAGRRLVVQRADTELVVADQELGTVARFPAPWPRDFGTVTVSPDGDTAVYCGTHSVRCVDVSGATRWEVRHACWAGECPQMHEEFAEYAYDEEHAAPDSGSAAFSSDGKLVWAHVRGPLAADGDSEAEDAEDEVEDELWLVLDASDGRVLARADTGTFASGSHHTPHPDPAQTGLSIGEGEEGSPALWGRWDGKALTVHKIDDETVLLDVSPSGRHLLATDVGQDALYLHAADDGAILRDLDAEGTVPGHQDGGRVYWDFEAAFTDEDTVVASTAGSDAGHGPARHWLVSTGDMTLRGGITYPHPVTGPARAAGNGAWYTVSEDGTTVSVWELTNAG